MIEVVHLSKSYGAIAAVHDLSFSVEAGQVVGFLGPNGAGKSTTLRILAGFLGASSGKVTIAGFDIVDERHEALKRLGYMPETSPLYPEMKVREYLSFRAELKDVLRSKRRTEVGRCLELAQLSDMAEMVIGHLSKGYRQRVGIADALLASPPLLILDEPTAGLDPNQIREVRALIGSLGERHTVLLSTHILSEVEASCSRAIVIAKGRLVAEGSIDAIRGRGRPEVRLVVRGDEAVLRKALGAVDGLGSPAIETRGELLHATATLPGEGLDDADQAVEQVVASLAKVKLGVRSVTTSAASLEEVFAELTGKDDRPPGRSSPAPVAASGAPRGSDEGARRAGAAEEDAS
ncbi:MAG: ABC transporter ATP-binding protein [Deltaproteobacteria bacterium]|nr:ABC transporter ATP-binding protein [Deltaproteobacteria bacterium]